jgi:hypothetical protein
MNSWSLSVRERRGAMGPKAKQDSESVAKGIKRNTRRKFNSEKIRNAGLILPLFSDKPPLFPCHHHAAKPVRENKEPRLIAA